MITPIFFSLFPISSRETRISASCNVNLCSRYINSYLKILEIRLFDFRVSKSISFYIFNDERRFPLRLAYHCRIFIRDLPCLIAATWCVSRSYFIRGCTRVIKVSGLQTEIVARRFSSRGRSSRRCGIVARGSFVDRGLGETVRSDRR